MTPRYGYEKVKLHKAINLHWKVEKFSFLVFYIFL